MGLPGSFIHQSNTGHVFKDRTRGKIGSLDKYGLLTRPTHMQLIERFEKRPALNAVIALDENSNAAAHAAAQIANKDWEVLGTNMTTALCTYSTGGGIVLTTAGAASDQAIVTPHLDTNQSSWASGRFITTAADLYMSFWIRTGSAITTSVVWAGLKLTNTHVDTTDADQFYFRYENGVNSGKWQINTSRSNVDVNVDTGVTAALSTDYFLELLIDANRLPTAWINGTQVLSPAISATGGAALTTAITLIPYVGVFDNAGGSARAVRVRQIVAATLAA